LVTPVTVLRLSSKTTTPCRWLVPFLARGWSSSSKIDAPGKRVFFDSLQKAFGIDVNEESFDEPQKCEENNAPQRFSTIFDHANSGAEEMGDENDEKVGTRLSSKTTTPCSWLVPFLARGWSSSSKIASCLGSAFFSSAY